MIDLSNTRLLGVTGTHHGMSAPQRATFAALVLAMPVLSSVHHGGCVGADTECDDIVRVAKPSVVHHVHLGEKTEWPGVPPQGFPVVTPIRHRPPTWVYPRTTNLVRNRRIVSLVEVLIGFPHLSVEERRSGTWATIRWAWLSDVPHVIVWPDGEAELAGVPAI